MGQTQYEHMGQAILERRKRLGLSQQEFADRADISRPHLSQVERGHITWPSAHFRRKVARALGVPHALLIVWAGELAEDEANAATGETPPRLARLLWLADQLDDDGLAILESVAETQVRHATARVEESEPQLSPSAK